MMEQRSDTFKNTAAQSQVKVLQLEQEKVRGNCDIKVHVQYVLMAAVFLFYF